MNRIKAYKAIKCNIYDITITNMNGLNYFHNCIIRLLIYTIVRKITHMPTNCFNKKKCSIFGISKYKHFIYVSNQLKLISNSKLSTQQIFI